MVPNFMKPKKIDKLVTIVESSDSTYSIDDRKNNLTYAHTAYRIEVTLRTENARMYKKIIESTISLCEHHYVPLSELTGKNKIFPELEYIVYDSAISPGAFIEPHVDNHSIITGIVMLSDPEIDFVGGVNCFKGKTSEDSTEEFRQYQLARGDLVLFRGEELIHWITPVISGIRKIIQWEFSRI